MNERLMEGRKGDVPRENAQKALINLYPSLETEIIAEISQSPNILSSAAYAALVNKYGTKSRASTKVSNPVLR